MKKNLLFALLSIVSIGAFAQTPFFQAVPYRGAFAPQPTARWTDGWTNFDPQNTNYPAVTVSVPPGDITVNTTWTANNVYELTDFTYVTNNATLTIEPGTIIRSQDKGTLIICRGAKLMANGTAANPIVFTSNQPAGGRDYGDWGGVVLTGKAVNNIPTSPNAPCEGGIAKPSPSTDGYHGGSDDADNSGSLSYVRIEFPGQALTTASNSEINGLTLYSVGSGTTIEYLQVSYSGDDSYEWFGGKVDCKHIVAFKGWDDDFDTDNGYRGRVQFAASIRDSRFADQSGSNGFESDNDAQGSDNTPKTEPIFSNVTIIGPNWTGNTDSTNINFKRAAHIRRNSGCSIFNSIETGYPSAGLYLDSRKTCANLINSVSSYQNNILAGCKNVINWAANSDTLAFMAKSDVIAWAMASPQNTDTLVGSAEVDLVNPFGNTNTDPDLRPKTTSPATAGAIFTNAELLPLNTTAVEEVKGNTLTASVYPNPTSGPVTVQFMLDKSSDVNIQIMDLSGKAVMTLPAYNFGAGSNNASFDVSNLSSGVYMIRVETSTSKYVSKLIVR